MVGAFAIALAHRTSGSDRRGFRDAKELQGKIFGDVDSHDGLFIKEWLKSQQGELVRALTSSGMQGLSYPHPASDYIDSGTTFIDASSLPQRERA